MTYQWINIPATRDGIPDLLNGLGLIGGEGVEIGVQEGNYSAILLNKWNCERLWMIDCWEHQQNYKDTANCDNASHQMCMMAAIIKTHPKNFWERSRILRLYSAEAVVLFADESLDFVYIDGNHSYEATKRDIELWYPKVKMGGVCAGHDYANYENEYILFGVKRAVDEFFAGKEPVLQTRDNMEIASWATPSWLVLKGQGISG